MSTLNIQQLGTDIVSKASAVLKTDVTTIQGFAQQQIEAIAQQADVVATGIADNAADPNQGIRPALQGYFLDNLEQMIESFAETLVGILRVVLEQMINAVVGVIWGAINTATGLTLAVPGV